MTEELHREIGRHGAEINALQKDMTEVKQDVKTILEFINQGRGGWKTIMLVAGAAGTVGALAAKIVSFMGK